MKFRLDIGGLCPTHNQAGKQPKQWAIPVAITPLGYTKQFPVVQNEKQSVSTVLDEGCSVEIIKAVLVSAENETKTISGAGVDPEDLTVPLKTIQAQRDAEAAEQAKRDVEQAKKDAAEAQRQTQLQAERRKKQAQEAASLAKYEADQAAKEAAERAMIRAKCGTLYDATANKKVSDLTVKESQQVQACQRLNLYPPR